MPDALDAILNRLSYYHDGAGWNESDHPRDPDGKFSSTNGGGAGKAKPGTIPKIAASQGKPYEHIFEAAHDPELTDEEKLEKINKLIAQFQDKYKGGYLKSIAKYGENVKTAMQTGVWPGKKKGAVEEPAGETAPPAPAQKGGDKPFTKDGPMAEEVFKKHDLASELEFWGGTDKPTLNPAQQSALNAWEEIKGAKELSDTPEQYKDTLAQIKVQTNFGPHNENESAFAQSVNDYLNALKQEAGVVANLTKETKAEKKSLESQWNDVIAAQLNGTVEDKFTPEDVAAAHIMGEIKTVLSSSDSDHDKAEILNEFDVSKLFNDDDEVTGFAKEVADHLTKTVAELKSKDAAAKAGMASGEALIGKNGGYFTKLNDALTSKTVEAKNELDNYLSGFSPNGPVVKIANKDLQKIGSAITSSVSLEELSKKLSDIELQDNGWAQQAVEKYLENMKADLAAHLGDEKLSDLKSASAPEPTKPASIPAYKPEQMSETTKTSKAEVEKSLGLMQNEVNKATVKTHLQKIDEAFAKPTYQEQQEALKSIQPATENSYSMGIQNLNKYLGELKKDFGVSEEPKSAGSKLTPTQEIKNNIIAPTKKNASWNNLKKIFDNSYDTTKGLNEHILPSHDEASWNKIPSKIKNAFKTYTGSSYTDMNTALRKNTPLSEHLLEKIHDMDDLFEEDFAVVKQDMKVWRGEHVPDEQIKEWEDALKNNLPARYSKKGFISTRTSPKGYADQANVQFEIVVPKGHKAINIKPVSDIPKELEVLMRHGQNFHILEIEGKGSQKIVKMVAI